ncbi:S-adenosyl-L-methionine-dependent methyltransferase [Zopfochytrium polystomum]|nr:S-adenosyl-L-methionine-dependent methyltransferase [Zopfochytrium polystomum]
MAAPSLRFILFGAVATVAGAVIGLSAALYRHAASTSSPPSSSSSALHHHHHHQAGIAAAAANAAAGAAAAQVQATSYGLPAATTPGERQAQARFLQTLYCRHFYPVPPSTTTMQYAPLKIAGFHPDASRKPIVDDLGMYIISDQTDSSESAATTATTTTSDIVSNFIWAYGAWEWEVTQGFLAALAEAEAVGVADPLFVDIGSNLGMHSVAVLAYGYRVVSIDALTMNGHHFMSTLCRHPQLMKKSTFIQHGLGSAAATCAIGSLDANLGDGTVTCDPSAIAQYKGNPRPPNLLPFRQWLPIAPLDSFLDEDAWVLKMDVEGFELDVLRGGRKLFTRRRVPFLLTEIQGEKGDPLREKSKKMVVLLKEYGYSCSEEGWYGKRWVIPEKPGAVVLHETIYNMWCIHPAHLRAAGLGEKVDAALANV